MEGLTVKRAEQNEADWAAQLMAESEPWITLGTTADQFLETLNDPNYLVFVARQNEIPAGLIVMHPRGLASSPYIKSIAVAQEYRGHGIGTALIEFAENYFRQQAKHIFLCVSSFNSRAQSLYQSLGYHTVGELKDYIMDGESEILMTKRLK